MSEPESKFLPETIFAMRIGGKWYVTYRLCTAAELPAVLAAEGHDHSELRVLREWRANKLFIGDYAPEVALKLGWVQHWQVDNCYPMEEPMPWLSGQPQPASVAFALTSIGYGGIAFNVSTTSRTIACFLDDIEDSLVLFVRFTRLIRDGGCPQARLLSSPRTFFVVQAMPNEPGRIRLFVRQRDEKVDQRIDVHLDRSALLNALRTFLSCIAYDETFGHMFLCFCELHGAHYDRIDQEIEAEWRAAVDAGTEDPDNDAAEHRFYGSRLAARYPLPPDRVHYVQAYKDMLRTLDIPAFWLAHPYRAF